MPVIVNEFEVIADAPAAQTGSATQPVAPSAAPAPPPTPEAVEQLMRRALARRLRLLAD